MTDGRPMHPGADTAHPMAALGAALTTSSAALFLRSSIVERAVRFERPSFGLLPLVLHPYGELESMATDEHRGKFRGVRVKSAEREGEAFVVRGPGPARTGERRPMNDSDGHHQGGRPFAPSPERAVDRAIVDGRNDTRLLYSGREAVTLLQVEDATHEQSRTAIASAFGKFYAGGEGAAAGLADRGASRPRPACSRSGMAPMSSRGRR